MIHLYSTRKRTAVFIFTLLCSLMAGTSLLAYQPGKWSPMDVYIENGKKGGPSKLILKGADGKVIETAEFAYDKDGRLVVEKFYNEKGKYTGKTEYSYVKGNLSLEVLSDASGNVISKKEYKVGRRTIDVVVLDGSGQVIMRHYIRHNKFKVTGGREKDENSNDQFVVEYDKNGNAVKFKLIRNDGTSISEIHYKYDASGKVISRILKNETDESMCNYEYDGSGNIVSYTYFNFTPGNWIKDRTLEFKYGNTANNENEKKKVIGLN